MHQGVFALRNATECVIIDYTDICEMKDGSMENAVCKDIRGIGRSLL